MIKNSIPQGFRTFLLIWFGQLISLTGSGLTGFALGVWVYQRTGSVTQFALISFFTYTPGIVFSPIAGALVDRWDRRWAMILSDAGAGLCTLSMALLLMADKLEIWQIYIAMAISSAFSAFQWPAYSAATTLLVPKKHLGRASGMVQMSESTTLLVSPILAGALIGLIHIQGIILIDFATFLFATLTLLIIRVPKPETTAEGKASQGSLLHEAAYGWKYIVARPGLLGLLTFFAITNFIMGLVNNMFTPLVLSFSTPIVLGTLVSIAGFGLLCGGFTMSVWGGPKRRIYSILGISLLQGAMLSVTGFPPHVGAIAIALFLFCVGQPIVTGCSQAIWQSKTSPDVQGRVFAVRRMIAWSSMPLAYLTIGPLIDYIFKPLLMEGGLLANSIGQIIGVGPGRGIGLLYIVLAIIYLLVTVMGFLSPRLLHVETELPDVIRDETPATTAA